MDAGCGENESQQKILLCVLKAFVLNNSQQSCHYTILSVYGHFSVIRLYLCKILWSEKKKEKNVVTFRKLLHTNIPVYVSKEASNVFRIHEVDGLSLSYSTRDLESVMWPTSEFKEELCKRHLKEQFI